MCDKPYFSVGEEVILESKDYPELNGDSTIESICHKNEISECPICGNLCRYLFEHEFAYYLNTAYKNNCCTPWLQSALRKKHDKGMGFESLVESLKTPLEVNQ